MQTRGIMGSKIVRIHLLPQSVREESLAETCVVVIDVFRASTTMVHALSNGAVKIIPALTVEEAKFITASNAGSMLLAGERDAVKPDGFHLGNSPLEYLPDVVAGRSIAMTTSNGTVALSQVRNASKVLVGCFANISATVMAAGEAAGPVHLVCSGTHHGPSLEDTLAAGVMAQALTKQNSCVLSDDDTTQTIVRLMEHIGPEAINRLARRSTAARRLCELGFNDDIATALAWNSHAVVPELVRYGDFPNLPFIVPLKRSEKSASEPAAVGPAPP
jgi:2-phosphosulfolactate phosphatase